MGDKASHVRRGAEIPIPDTPKDGLNLTGRTDLRACGALPADLICGAGRPSLGRWGQMGRILRCW